MQMEFSRTYCGTRKYSDVLPATTTTLGCVIPDARTLRGVLVAGGRGEKPLNWSHRSFLLFCYRYYPRTRKSGTHTDRVLDNSYRCIADEKAS